MQVQTSIAAHNSVHATNMLGKETVWKTKAVPIKASAPPIPTS